MTYYCASTLAPQQLDQMDNMIIGWDKVGFEGKKTQFLNFIHS